MLDAATVNTFWPSVLNLTLTSTATVVATSLPYKVKPSSEIRKTTSIETLAIPCKQEPEIKGDVPWWVYLIASALGLLLLLLLILLLRCLGFFRRRHQRHKDDAVDDEFQDEDFDEAERERMMIKAKTIKSNEEG